VSNRNSQDARIVAQFQARGTGQLFNYQFTSPTLAAGTACTSSLHDGIFDGWKTKYNLSLTDTGLAQRVDPVTGLTYLEDFLDGLVP
jgi:hypothetical protein